jgi:hypothetical protein
LNPFCNNDDTNDEHDYHQANKIRMFHSCLPVSGVLFFRRGYPLQLKVGISAGTLALKIMRK